MRVAFARRLLVCAVALTSTAGCHKTWQSDTLQPTLRLGSSQEARTSFAGHIRMRDFELPYFLWLDNSAYFVVVSKDRLRFHVTLNHKWRGIADPARWRVHIEDHNGRRFRPEGIDRRIIKPISEVYYPGHRRSVNWQPILSYTVYRGDGDYVFYSRDLFNGKLQTLTLVMKRPGYEYRYSWQFVSDGETGVVAAVPVR